MWWEIYRIIKEKAEDAKPVKYLCLENVDRLIRSPGKQKGKDFAIMLASLSDLGYAVEWRVINAADYGFPQRRRRVFLLAYHRSTTIYKELRSINNAGEWLSEHGTFAKAFPAIRGPEKIQCFSLDGELSNIAWNKTGEFGLKTPFQNSGLILERKVTTQKLLPFFTGPKMTLNDIILKGDDIDESFYLDKTTIANWQYLKGAKDVVKVNKKTGAQHRFKEGSTAFPDPLNKPSRTVITSEGGTSASRTTHVIKTKDGRLRRLMPVELERLNLFPENHTKDASNVKRGFLMGNALVVGIVEMIGKQLAVKHFGKTQKLMDTNRNQTTK